jgi:hypothetical protein
MSNGYIRWYEREWSARRAAERVDALARSGISLRNDSDGRITALRDDLGFEGDLIEFTESEALAELAMTMRDELSIKFWFRADENVYATLTRPGGPRIITEFDLDGVGREDRELLLGFILVHLELTDLLVVDLSGGTDPDDWDAFAGGSGHGSLLIPDLIALSGDLVESWPWPGTPPHRIGPLVGLDRTGVIERARVFR